MTARKVAAKKVVAKATEEKKYYFTHAGSLMTRAEAMKYAAEESKYTNQDHCLVEALAIVRPLAKKQPSVNLPIIEA